HSHEQGVDIPIDVVDARNALLEPSLVEPARRSRELQKNVREQADVVVEHKLAKVGDLADVPQERDGFFPAGTLLDIGSRRKPAQRGEVVGSLHEAQET